MYYVYILYSGKFNRQYVGLTINVEKRLEEHNSGKTLSTKAFKPWIVVHIEEYESRKEARVREKYLKTAAGRRWRKINIKLAP